MAIISPEDRQSLQTLFAQELQDDVNITYFTQRESVLSIPGQESSPCKETRELLEELTGTSDKLHLTVKDFVRDEQEAQNLGITRIPAFILQGHTRSTIRYFGMPAGYEFSTLVEDLIDVSKGTTGLSEKTREILAMVNQDLQVCAWSIRMNPAFGSRLATIITVIHGKKNATRATELATR